MLVYLNLLYHRKWPHSSRRSPSKNRSQNEHRWLGTSHFRGSLRAWVRPVIEGKNRLLFTTQGGRGVWRILAMSQWKLPYPTIRLSNILVISLIGMPLLYPVGDQAFSDCARQLLSNFWRLEQLLAVLGTSSNFAFLNNFWGKCRFRAYIKLERLLNDTLTYFNRPFYSCVLTVAKPLIWSEAEVDHVVIHMRPVFS